MGGSRGLLRGGDRRTAIIRELEIINNIYCYVMAIR